MASASPSGFATPLIKIFSSPFDKNGGSALNKKKTDDDDNDVGGCGESCMSPTPIKMRSSSSNNNPMITPRKLLIETPIKNHQPTSPTSEAAGSSSSSPPSSPISLLTPVSSPTIGQKQHQRQNHRVGGQHSWAFICVSCIFILQLCIQYGYYKIDFPSSSTAFKIKSSTRMSTTTSNAPSFQLQSTGSTTYNKQLYQQPEVEYFAPSLNFQYHQLPDDEQEQQRPRKTQKQRKPPNALRSAAAANNKKKKRNKFKEQKLKEHRDFTCKHKALDLQWEWYTTTTQTRTTTIEVLDTTTTTTKDIDDEDGDMQSKTATTSKRLLIALYAGYDEYAKLLNESAKIAKLYATIWGPNVSVLVLQGTAFAPGGCQPPPSHTTLNKIRLLFHAIDRSSEYDQLLLMDADTLIINMKTDITKLFPTSSKDNDDYLVVTGPIKDSDDHTKRGRKDDNMLITNLPTGVMLWNLHHPVIRDVAIDWFGKATDAVKRGKYENDNAYLHVPQRLVLQKRKELDASKGTIIRHYSKNFDMKNDKKNNSRSLRLRDRQNELSKHADGICKEYSNLCDELSTKKI